MSNFSFTNFINRNGGNNNTQTNGANAVDRGYNRPTPKQINYYNDLCARRNIKPQDINKFTFDTLGKEIERINALPMPASPKQIQKIKEIIAEINALGGNINPLSDEQLSKLTGGRTGTASSLIETLFKQRQALNEFAPPSDKQIEIMVDWFLCPDIPFENYNITKKVPVNYLNSWSTDHNVPSDLDKQLWRLMTPNEFAEQIRTHMTKKKASKFIDDYRGVFYAWRQTRITPGQVEYIRELEERLNTIEPVSDGVQFTIRDGEIIQENMGKRESRTRREEKGGYNCLSDMELAQLSVDDASDWIDRLKDELAKQRQLKTMYNEEDVYGTYQQDLEDKFLVRGELKKFKDANDADVDQFNKLNDLIYAVEALLGYEDMEAHDKVKHILLDKEASDQYKADCYQYLQNFFLATVTADKNKNEPQWVKEMARIFNMCEESDLALEILSYQAE